VPFSLGSYLLGVGTVVGALAFGFGSGVLLTNTPVKETAAAPTRTERVARAEPKPPAQQPKPPAQQEKPPVQQEKPAAPQEKPPAQQDTRANPALPAEPAASSNASARGSKRSRKREASKAGRKAAGAREASLFSEAS